MPSCNRWPTAISRNLRQESLLYLAAIRIQDPSTNNKQSGHWPRTIYLEPRGATAIGVVLHGPHTPGKLRRFSCGGHRWSSRHLLVARHADEQRSLVARVLRLSARLASPHEAKGPCMLDAALGRRPCHSERSRTGWSAVSWFPVPARHGVTKILWIWAPERVRCSLRLTRDQQVACRTSLPGCYRKNSQCPSFRAARGPKKVHSSTHSQTLVVSH